MKKSFSISPRILLHLGEDLIKNESIALLELVKNSFDACASICQIKFETDSNRTLKKIIIEDNGFGMDKDIIENVWLVVGTEFKSKIEPNICGRIPLGEKGIGRLSVHKLGNKITIISKKKDSKEIVVDINWKNLYSARKVDDFTIELTENDFPLYFLKTNGTRIVIEDLKTNWDYKQIREVYRALTSLNSPFPSEKDQEKIYDSFTVDITSNSDLFEGLPKFEEIKQSALYFCKCKMKQNKITEFKYSFVPWPTLTKIDKGRIKNKLLSEEYIIIDEDRNEIDLEEMKIGPVDFDLVIFETDNQIFNYINLEKKSIKEYLKENGGIRVYRDGIRVYDYGERDNDWLGIDLKRVSRVGGRVSNNIILGSVKIERRYSLGLKEKTNREGFIENKSYKAFTSAINYALSLFVKERNIDKHKLTTLYKQNKVIEPVLSDLDEAINLIEEKINNGKTKEELLKYLTRIGVQYKEVKEILVKSANAGLNVGVVIHELEKLLSELSGSLARKELKKAIDISKALESIVRGYMAMVKKSSLQTTKLSEIVENALEAYDFRFTDHDIDVITNHRQNNAKALLSTSESISALINLLDNSIFWLSFARISKRKISLFITDQIQGYQTIVVSDNGPGFNLPTDIAIEPFITGKPHNIGSGLGLHIANEMMKAMKGRLLFLDEGDISFPEEIIKNKVTKAIIGLCFSIEK